MVKRRKKSKGRGPKFFRELPPTANSYNGPVLSPADKADQDCYTIVLSSPVAVTASAGGVIDTVVNDDPTGYTDYASLNLLFHEYRVLAMEAKYVPFNKFDPSGTTAQGPFMHGVDRESAGLFGSYAAALAHPNVKVGHTGSNWSTTVKMSNSEEANFVSLTTPIAKHWIKYYATGLTNNHQYGLLFVRLRVQFRGRY